MNLIESTVVSTRIRLARNVHGYPFPNMIKSRAMAREIVNIVNVSLKPLKERFSLYYIDSLSPEEAEKLKENYLVSNALLKNGEYSALIANPDGNISIMINEEDHIREQCFERGLCLEKAYELLLGIDACIGESVVFAKNPRFGYLTSCLTNVGTGMRASVMMFLPALTRRNKIGEVIKRISPQGFILRGGYGEGSGSEGYLYQLSNEFTLGVRESDTLMKVKDTTALICKIEATERMNLKDEDLINLKDSCGRAYGILLNAEILSYPEFLKLISEVKLGVTVGLYAVFEMEKINELIVAMRPSNIVVQENESKDVFRAACVRRFLKSTVMKAE